MSARANIHDDAFTFAIDVVTEDGKLMEKVAGANNISVAHKAFDEMLLHRGASDWLLLRQRGRVIRREAGQWVPGNEAR
ncbi:MULTISPECIES: hypothetical protein [unclassified Sinorhizobium]|uniref:hypothetical protein n=1 Tax=unclassified Sinorhizobium TaxID=2613772 RepID=UPI003524C420